MRKITLVFTLIFAALLLFASCDYLDFDIPFLDVETDTEEPGQHTHEYGEIQSDSDSHFNICRCGDVINSEPHVEGKNGICTVCAYVVRDVFDVSVSADEGINITTTVYSVNRGDSLYFSVSTEQNRSLTVVGADKLSEEIYGNLVIHQLYIASVESDIVVVLTSYVIQCSHEWSRINCTYPEVCALCGETRGTPIEHSMSEVTCTDPAICSACGYTDGVLLEHNMSEATCTAPAICSACGYTDRVLLEHSMSEVTCTDPAICSACGYTDGVLLEHSMSEVTCTDPAICSACGYTDGVLLEHSMSEATCTAPAICSACGYTDRVLLEHNMSEITCTDPAVCSVCGYTDGVRLQHVMSNATCTTPAVCLLCGYENGTALGHSMSDATCTAPMTCTLCGLTEGKPAEHTYTVTCILAATCTEEGYNKHTCTCGVTYQSIIRPLGHSGGTPTYTTEGICEKCNERYLPMLKLTYGSYGAVGDGVTDDFLAIKATHAYANANGLTVYADKGKTYNLGQHNDNITIMTDTVWDDATFIIDDRTVEASDAIRGRSVFNIAPDYSNYNVRISGSLQAGQENIGVTFDTQVLLYIANSNVKQYIRYGANANSGANQQELILVDAHGNVDPSTPIMWDYDVVTSAIAYPVGDKPITISGGTFITRANAAPREYTYYARNITVRRSNVTITGVTHLITDEGDTGAPYNGFFAISYCNNVNVENSVFTGHKVYKLSGDVNNSMGTYDISLNSANKITFKNCTQTNSITDTTYWGVMGSNYCKNLTYDGCIFSRFDAHQGTYNATIINSEIGHQKLSVIGKGTLYIENTVFHSDTVVALRTDYGSTWDGEIIFKNITINNVGTPILVNAGWNNHYFGYTCHLPAKIVVDGVTLANKDYFYVLPNLPSHVDDATVNGAVNKNPLQLTETIVIASNPNGYKYYVSVNKELFANVQVVVI